MDFANQRWITSSPIQSQCYSFVAILNNSVYLFYSEDVGEQGSGTATLSNVPNLLKETSKTYEMKTTAEKLCKNCVCFKVRKGNPVSLPIKQKIPKYEIRELIRHGETETLELKEKIGKPEEFAETPVALDEVPKVVLHIIPLNAFDPAKRYDVSSLAQESGRLAPIYASSWSVRHNFDGVLSFSQFTRSSSAHSYLQLFRNGSIEAVEAYLLDEGIIPSVAFEEELLKALPKLLEIQGRLSVDPPLFIMLSLLGVSGYTMAVDKTKFWWPEEYPIDRDSLIIPEVLVEKFGIEPAEVMRPIFDAIWNAAGWPKSMNYDKNGKWTRH
jgi:hypothetical protein